MRSPLLVATALLAASLLSAVPTAAQTSPGGDAKQPSKSRELQVTDAKLAAFVDAVVKVERIGAAWKPKVEAAKSKQEADTLMRAAHDEMRHAVEASPGITLAEYAAIASASVENEKLGAEVETRLKAARQKQ